MNTAELSAVSSLADAKAVAASAEDVRFAAEERFSALERKLADGEAAAVEASRARAMGESVANAPPLTQLAEWRLEKAGLASAIDDLRARNTLAMRKVELCEKQLKAEAHERLKTEARSAALTAYQAATEQLRSAFVEMMAVDGLINERFPDPSRRHTPNYSSAEEIFGPGALLMTGMTRQTWPEYPYATRPIWAPKNDNRRVFQHPDVAATQARILREFGL